MATPNLINATTINGLTAVAAVTTTLTAIVTNASSSGKAQRINSLIVSNVNGTSAATVTVTILRSATNYRLVYNMSVPAASSLDLINKTIYLNEGDALVANVSTNNSCHLTASYEVLS